MQTASVGTASDDQPAMPEVQQFLADLGIDVSEHRSHRVDAQAVAAADLVLTAEVQHVVHVAGSWPGTFARTFTLPEFVARAGAVGARAGAPMGEWLARMSVDRPTGLAYLQDGSVPEVHDPTGGPPAVWEASFAEIDEWCRQAAELLA